MALDDNKTEKSQVKVKMKNLKIILIYMDINKTVKSIYKDEKCWKLMKFLSYTNLTKCLKKVLFFASTR